MADAPKTESSSGWGAFEIGLVVIIVIALLTKGGALDTSNSSDDQNTTQTQQQDTYADGIQITSPARKAVVGKNFTLRGVIDGGYWNPNPADGNLLSYQVIDDQGVPLSEFKTIKKDPTLTHASYVFEENVTLTNQPKTKTGMIIFVSPTVDANNQTVSLRFPIRFEN